MLFPRTELFRLSRQNQHRLNELFQVARENNKLIDATYGRRTRAVIITDSDHVVLSAVQPETVGQRVLSHE